MVHRDFDHASMKLAGKHQHLGVDEGPLRVQGHAREQVPAGQPEGAIHIAHEPAKKEAHQREERPRVEPTQQRIAPMLAVSGDDVGIGRAGKQQLDLCRVELIIGIHQEDPGEARSAKARSKRRPVAAIDRVTDDAQIRVRRLEPFQHRRGPVLAAVIDDDDLESARERLEGAGHPPHRLRQVGLLVVGGHHRADLHGRHRRGHGAKPTRMNTVATSSRLSRRKSVSWPRMPVSGCALGSTMASGCAWARTSSQPEAR